MKTNEKIVLEELGNIVDNEPLWPGDTIAHHTANECVRRGWAARKTDGNFVSTPEGRARAVQAERERLAEVETCICHETVVGKSECPVHGSPASTCLECGGPLHPDDAQFCTNLCRTAYEARP